MPIIQLVERFFSLEAIEEQCWSFDQCIEIVTLKMNVSTYKSAGKNCKIKRATPDQRQLKSE